MRLDKIILLLAIIFGGLAGAGCEKVIDINLNDAAPVVVLEAYLTDQPGSARIQISKTTNFFGGDESPIGTGATVILSDDIGNTWTLPETEPGIYADTSIVAATGRTYTMSVDYEGINYTAVSSIPTPVTLDSLDVIVFPFGGNISIVVRPEYDDPLGIQNYYRFLITKNDTLQPDIFTADDRLSDGKTTGAPLFGVFFEFGDEATVELHAIDNANYEYYTAITDAIDAGGSGGGNPAAPGNPISNWSNDALGVFTVAAVSTRSITF